MKFFDWLKFRKKFRNQIKNPLDESVQNLVRETLQLFPETLDISDGELCGGKGFYSKNLSDAWHNAEDLNATNAEDVDFMIWAIYGVLHEKSRMNYSKGITTVNISELSCDKIGIEYIKSCLTAEFLE